MKHFSYYPKINYSNEESVNILVRGKIRDVILEENALYYKHTIKDNERADIIATKYYGNPQYTWAIFYANNIFHPTLDWPLDYANFNNYLIKKYGSIEKTKLTTHHYELLENNIKYVISEKTYNEYLNFNVNVTSDADRKNISRISIYEYENLKNEDKRNILILDSSFIYTITNEMKLLFK